MRTAHPDEVVELNKKVGNMRIIDEHFYLTKTEILAVCLFAARDTTREHLAAIEFDPRLGTVTATDGHTLVSASALTVPASSARAFLVRATAGPSARAFLVRATALVAASKQLAKGAELEIYAGPDCAVLSAGATTSRVEFTTGNYPDWLQVIPSEMEPGHHPCKEFKINAKYLTRLSLVQTAAQAEGVLAMPPREATSPILFKIGGHESSWIVVIMPMR